MVVMNTAGATGPNHRTKVPGSAKAVGSMIEEVIDGSLEHGGMTIAEGMTGI